MAEIKVTIGGQEIALKRGMWVSAQAATFSGRLKSIEKSFSDSEGKARYRIAIETYITLDEIDYVSYKDRDGTEHDLHKR